MFRESGVINFYKPPDISSHQAIKIVQKIIRAKKVGHAGTLDPLAEGVLLTCLNRATRISEYLAELGKEYETLIRLGIITDTYDITGKIIEEKSPEGVTVEDLKKALSRFSGEIMQEPPMYSAIKVQGVPLYRLARKGIVIQRRKKKVQINSMELLQYKPYRPFEFSLRVQCSNGTYIRSLAHDIGRILGVGAIVVRLKRTGIGHFTVDNAVTIEKIKKGEFNIFTIDEALRHFEDFRLNYEQFNLARHGIEFPINSRFLSGELVNLRGPDGQFFAIGRVKDNEYIRTEKVFL